MEGQNAFPSTPPMGFPGGAVVKNLRANEGDTGDPSSIPGSGRSSEEGNGTPLQYSCLESSMDRGPWQAAGPWGPKRVGHNLVTEQQQF